VSVSECRIVSIVFGSRGFSSVLAVDGLPGEVCDHPSGNRVTALPTLMAINSASVSRFVSGCRSRRRSPSVVLVSIVESGVNESGRQSFSASRTLPSLFAAALTDLILNLFESLLHSLSSKHRCSSKQTNVFRVWRLTILKSAVRFNAPRFQLHKPWTAVISLVGTQSARTHAMLMPQLIEHLQRGRAFGRTVCFADGHRHDHAVAIFQNAVSHVTQL
jgi:hypothetical protein